MADLDSGSTIRGFAPDTRVFNRYILRRILGRGGMGVVWLARDEELDRDVALKFLPEVVALDPASIADLKRETRRNLELTHPNIVRIYDFLQDTRSAAISMEYVDGTSLSTLRLERPDRVFPLTEVDRFLTQLVDGLAYAHEKAKIVHRDLKPANLMVNSRGELKITDFGIATSIADSVSRVSGQGSSGTAVYMSPQQMMGEKPSVTDDIYSLGATIYELLTSKPPFYTGNIILQVTQKVPPTMAARREELGVGSAEKIPESWERLVAACLAKEPTDRPASVRAVLSLLRGETAKMGRGVPDAAPSSPPADGKPAAPTATPTPAPATPSASSSKQSSAPLWISIAAAVVVIAGGTFFWLRSRDTASAPPTVEGNNIVADTKPTPTPPVEEPKTSPVDDTAKELLPAQEAATVLTQIPDLKPVVSEPPKPLPASLRLTTDPADATVRVGDRTLPAPLDLTDLPAGPIELIVTRDGYRERRLQFELAAGQSLELPVVRLEEILTPVTLEGRQQGLTYTIQGTGDRRYSGSLPDRLELSRGDYSVTVQRLGYGEKRYNLVVRDQPVKFNADVPGARIEVTSTPVGATVRTGDRVLGVTPLTLEDQPPGQLALTIGAQHFDDQTFTADLRGGETWSRSVQLSLDAATQYLQKVEGYWSSTGVADALGDAAIHLSATDRKMVMIGKFLWSRAVMDGPLANLDPDVGGLVFNVQLKNWKGTFVVQLDGENIVGWYVANPKQKWKFRRMTEDAYLKLHKSVTR